MSKVMEVKMKLVNEKGKLFGIINPVDLLALIVVIVVIVGIAWQLFGNKVTEVVSPNVEMTTEVIVSGAPPELCAEVERQNLVGQKLVATNNYLDATITDVRLVDYAVQVQTADGKIVNATDPTKKNIVFDISSKVARDTASPKIGNQDVKAGRTYLVKTQAFEVSGTIYYVKIGD